jgi:hypothetical protein
MQGRFPKGIAPFAFYGKKRKSVERWNGIGGEMGLEKEKQTVERRPRRTGVRKQAVSCGTAKMKAAANKTLKEHSEQIADSLLNGTLKGNVISARLLIALAEKQTDCEDEKEKQSSCSLAKRLASEPEWSGEVSEAKAATGFEEREPEG